MSCSYKTNGNIEQFQAQVQNSNTQYNLYVLSNRDVIPNMSVILVSIIVSCIISCTLISKKEKKKYKHMSVNYLL